MRCTRFWSVFHVLAITAGAVFLRWFMPALARAKPSLHLGRAFRKEHAIGASLISLIFNLASGKNKQNWDSKNLIPHHFLPKFGWKWQNKSIQKWVSVRVFSGSDWILVMTETEVQLLEVSLRTGLSKPSSQSSSSGGIVEYMSLRDVLVEASPAGHVSESCLELGYDIHDFNVSNIGIHNHLLKHVASAYLHSAVVVVPREQRSLATGAPSAWLTPRALAGVRVAGLC